MCRRGPGTPKAGRADRQFQDGPRHCRRSNIVKGPASRDASDEEWIETLDAAIEERFRRYQGDNFYHLGISIEGYVLAQPGIPLVFSPKSVLIVNVTVFEDATGQKLNEEAEQLTALEAPLPKR